MVEMEPIENIVKRDRIAASKRPDLKDSTGSQLNQIGKHVYAYSGPVGVAAQKTLLNFTSGNKVISGRMYTGYCSPTAIYDDIAFEVKLNGVLISARYTDTSKEGNIYNMIYHTMVIPPYTKVEVLASNISSGTERDMCAIFTGEAFDA